MTTNIRYPRYSFVQDGSMSPPPGCYGDVPSCLPLSSNANLRFQATLTGITLAQMSHGVPGDPYLAVVPSGWPCPKDSIQFDTTPPVDDDLHCRLVPFIYSRPPYWISPATSSGTGIVQVCFDIPLCDFNILTTANNTYVPQLGDCFKLAIVWDQNEADSNGYSSGYTVLTRTFYGCTNCFVHTQPSECYSSVLSYSNPRWVKDTDTNETVYNDVFDFDYHSFSTYQNRVELPIFLRDPVMSNEQKVYTTSDGALIKFFEHKEEVYEMDTELMPYYRHKALDIALSHDYVQITNANINSFDSLNTATQFVKKENYEIEYMKAPLSNLGRGHCKLSNAAPVHLVNNNCG